MPIRGAFCKSPDIISCHHRDFHPQAPVFRDFPQPLWGRLQESVKSEEWRVEITKKVPFCDGNPQIVWSEATLALPLGELAAPPRGRLRGSRVPIDAAQFSNGVPSQSACSADSSPKGRAKSAVSAGANCSFCMNNLRQWRCGFVAWQQKAPHPGPDGVLGRKLSTGWAGCARFPRRTDGWCGRRRTWRRWRCSSGTCGRSSAGRRSPRWPSAWYRYRMRSPAG